jgi:hypothetical protein
VLLCVDQWSGDRAHLRARQEIVWARQGESLGRTLGQAFALEQPLLAVTAAGALPFYSGLPALDMLGLNDRYLALHPPADLGTGRIAHELGDGQYVLSREPDLVIFCGTSGVERACSRGGREMQADDRFAREYELVTLLGDFGLPVHGKVFVRTRSPRIGTSTTEQGAILIPGLLLNDRPGSLAGLDASGRLGALLFAGQPVSFAPLSLAPGHYRVDVEGSGHVALHARAIPAPGGVDLARGTAPLHFVVDPPGVEVELMLETDADEAHVRRIRIEREPDLPAPPQPSRGGS